MKSKAITHTSYRLHPEVRGMLKWLAEQDQRTQTGWLNAAIRREYAKAQKKAQQ